MADQHGHLRVLHDPGPFRVGQDGNGSPLHGLGGEPGPVGVEPRQGDVEVTRADHARVEADPGDGDRPGLTRDAEPRHGVMQADGGDGLRSERFHSHSNGSFGAGVLEGATL